MVLNEELWNKLKRKINLLLKCLDELQLFANNRNLHHLTDHNLGITKSHRRKVGKFDFVNYICLAIERNEYN